MLVVGGVGMTVVPATPRAAEPTVAPNATIRPGGNMWILFLIVAPHQLVYRRWGWYGIVAAWTAIIAGGALAKWVSKGTTANGEVQMVIGGAVILGWLALTWSAQMGKRRSRQMSDFLAELAAGGTSVDPQAGPAPVGEHWQR